MDRTENILYSKEQIQTRIQELGREISNDYKDGDVTIVSLLRGSFMFTADLCREITVPTVIEFMTTSSYEDREMSDGQVSILSDLREDIAGKDVLIVDDIVDSGNTMTKVVSELQKRNPKSIKVCVMLDKPSRRQVDFVPDYVGYSIDDLFIVGYGLNYGSYYRNIPYIFTWDEFNV